MASAALRVGGAAAAALATAAIAAAVQVAAPLAEKHEGYRGKAYLDPVKILTVCYGDTENVDPSRIYSKDECATRLRARMARDYAPYLGKCMPAFVGADWPRYTKIFGAALDAAYNTGPLPVCKRMGPLVNAGRLEEACNSLPGWYTSAKNRVTGVRKVYPGLVRRRKEEQALCKRGLAA